MDSTPETKCHNMVWQKKGEKVTPKAEVIELAGKVMATIFWNCGGVLLIDYMPHGTTIDTAGYCEVLTRVLSHFSQQTQGLLSWKVLPLHNNA